MNIEARAKALENMLAEANKQLENIHAEFLEMHAMAERCLARAEQAEAELDRLQNLFLEPHLN